MQGYKTKISSADLFKESDEKKTLLYSSLFVGKSLTRPRDYKTFNFDSIYIYNADG